MAYATGQTAVVVPVDAVQPVVAGWREAFDVSASLGMPAHITALSPFLPIDELANGDLASLQRLCARLPILGVKFVRTGRFPGVVYLEPEPAGGLRELTDAICRQWPQAPPYGGLFDVVIPHLTIAYGIDDEAIEEVAANVAAVLPLEARLDAAALYVFDGVRWFQQAGCHSWEPRSESKPPGVASSSSPDRV